MVMVLRIMPPSLAAASRVFLFGHCGCGIVLPSHLRRAVEGLTVPIRDILKVEYGSVFEPEEVASLTAAFDAALSKLSLVDRKDPMTTTVAKLIIQLAKDGERDPKKLCDQALKILHK
jgi:hypothetical protein